MRPFATTQKCQFTQYCITFRILFTHVHENKYIFIKDVGNKICINKSECNKIAIKFDIIKPYNRYIPGLRMDQQTDSAVNRLSHQPMLDTHSLVLKTMKLVNQALLFSHVAVAECVGLLELLPSLSIHFVPVVRLI